MSDLMIIDVSALIHTADSSDAFKERTYYNYPVGGIHFLMRYVSIALAQRDSVVLCFDSPTFRKELLPGYKSGRIKNSSVISQIETLYSGLSACGFRCEKYDGFEADDIVDWAVQSNLDNFGEIVIIGNDIDLCHSVQNKVRFKSIARDVNCIYAGNFAESVERGKTIAFNTISAHKVFCGCTSDKIPVMHASNGMSSEKQYVAYVKWLNEMEYIRYYSHTSSMNVLMKYVTTCGLYTTEDQIELLKRCKLVFPAAKPDDVSIIPNNFASVNQERLANFLSMYNDFDSLKCLGLKKATLSEDVKQELRDKARSLSNGEYAVDKDLDVSKRTTSSSVLSIDSFERDF